MSDLQSSLVIRSGIEGSFLNPTVRKRILSDAAWQENTAQLGEGESEIVVLKAETLIPLAGNSHGKHYILVLFLARFSGCALPADLRHLHLLSSGCVCLIGIVA